MLSAMWAMRLWTLATQVAAVAADWSPSSFARGNFRVQAPAAALAFGELWSFGGRGFDASVQSPGFDYIDQLWAYNLSNDSWRNVSVAGGPSPRSDASMSFADGKLWIFGGYVSGTRSAEFMAFDLQALSWQSLSTGPVARYGHASVVDGSGRIWILGGYVQGGSAGTLLDAWIYNVQGDSWSQAADGPGALADLTAIYEPNQTQICIFGGVPIQNGGWNSSKELWCLDIQADSWSNFTQVDGPGPRHNHVAVWADQGSRGVMWIHGGYFFDGASVKYSDVWAYDFGSETWTEAASASNKARYTHVAVMASDTMWIYGGTYSSVVDSVHAYLTIPTTTTTTTSTTTTGLASTANEALDAIEDFQDGVAAQLAPNASQEDLSPGTAVSTRWLPGVAGSMLISYQQVTVELPAALLQTLQAGSVLSLGLISEHPNSSFQLFEEPPKVLASPIASLQLYSAGAAITQLVAPVELTFPKPQLASSSTSRFRAECVFWDKALQRWSSEGMVLVSESENEVTCATEHLSLFALLFTPFLCSNAAAIFSSEGLDSLMSSSWALRLPATMMWASLVLGLCFLLAALALDRRHQMHRQQLLEIFKTSEEVKLTKKKSMELPKEEMEFHPKRLPKTLQKFLLKHLFSQILLSELGVDLKFLKQLYATAGFTRVHQEAQEILVDFQRKSLTEKSVVLFRVHCKWMKVSYPMMSMTSLERCAETLAKFWSGLALVAMWYSSSALAANLPSECDGTKGILEMIVRGLVVSTVGAIIGFLPVVVVILIQQKLIRSSLGRSAKAIFWVFIILYFVLSLYVVVVFLATVSALDGEDFLIGVLTAVARTILITPWVGVAFFLLLLSCVEVDVTGFLPATKHLQSYRLRMEHLALDGHDALRFKCQVSGMSEAAITDGEVPVCFGGLAGHHVILVSVYSAGRFVGSTAFNVSEAEPELPLQRRGRGLGLVLRLSATVTEMEHLDFPVHEGDAAVEGNGNEREEGNEADDDGLFVEIL